MTWQLPFTVIGLLMSPLIAAGAVILGIDMHDARQQRRAEIAADVARSRKAFAEELLRRRVVSVDDCAAEVADALMVDAFADHIGGWTDSDEADFWSEVEKCDEQATDPGMALAPDVLAGVLGRRHLRRGPLPVKGLVST